MKKIIFTILFIIYTLSFNLKAAAQNYTEEKALAEQYLEYLEELNAFDENKAKYQQEFKALKKDANRKENMERIKAGSTNSQNGYKVEPNYKILWIVTPSENDFIPSDVVAYDGTNVTRNALVNYAVIYDNSPNYEYIYDSMGNLQQVQISEKEYKKIYSYNGSLQFVIYTDGNGQTFTYNSNRKYRREIK